MAPNQTLIELNNLIHKCNPYCNKVCTIKFTYPVGDVLEILIKILIKEKQGVIT